VTTRAFQPLVIGAPRSGFALLCSVLSGLSPLAGPKSSLRLALLSLFADRLGGHISDAVVSLFERRGIAADLVYNGNFRLLAGGPRWVRREDPRRACFRKYIGVRGQGDLMIAVAHPVELLETDAVVHSHTDPAWWPDQALFSQYTLHASVRNPAGIVNSACFSLNALASEHIQRFLTKAQDNDTIRQELALYKLSDLKFFNGIVRFYAAYFEQFLPVRERYAVMRWEDLIDDPVPTIRAVADAAGTPIGPAFAAQIWDRLDHRNLTGHHWHNYRAGRGIVGDWRNWLNNRHLEIMRACGLEQVAVRLGYGPFEPIAARSHTEFQQRLDRLIATGGVHQAGVDADLFGYAFNKSNIDASEFNFRTHEWRDHSWIERTTLRDRSLEAEISDAVEMAASRLNRLFDDLLAAPLQSHAESFSALRSLEVDNAKFLRPYLPARYDAAFADANELLRLARFGSTRTGDAPDRRAPKLLYSIGQHNLVAHHGLFLGIPQSLGPIDLERENVLGRPGVVTARTLPELEAQVNDIAKRARPG